MAATQVTSVVPPLRRAMTMPSFVKFIIAIILLSVCVALGLGLNRSRHIRQIQALNFARERGEVDALFARLDKKFRRADMVVASQLIGGDKRVQATTLVFQRYGL